MILDFTMIRIHGYPELVVVMLMFIQRFKVLHKRTGAKIFESRGHFNCGLDVCTFDIDLHSSSSTKLLFSRDKQCSLISFVPKRKGLIDSALMQTRAEHSTEINDYEELN